MCVDSSLARTRRRPWQAFQGWIANYAQGTRANLQVLLRWRPGKKDVAEVLLIALALPLYYLVRGQAQERIEDAVRRGLDIVQFEKSLGIFWEVELQSWILPHQWLVTILNAFYLYGHLPIIGALAIWMYFWHRPQYLLMRNAFLLSGAIGLVIFLNFPTAPPRLLGVHGADLGFVDTILMEYHKSRPDTPSFFVNEYAAMPSLHLGWNLLVGISVWLATRNILMRAFAALMPLAMYIDIVLTANHYIVDGIAGFAVMLVGLSIALAGRRIAARALQGRQARRPNDGLAGWVLWLCGVAEGQGKRPLGAGQPA